MYQRWNVFNFVGLLAMSLLPFLLYVLVSSFVFWGHVQYTSVVVLRSPQMYFFLLLGALLVYGLELLALLHHNNDHSLVF